jgi:hypothetical protein
MLNYHKLDTNEYNRVSIRVLNLQLKQYKFSLALRILIIINYIKYRPAV